MCVCMRACTNLSSHRFHIAPVAIKSNTHKLIAPILFFTYIVIRYVINNTYIYFVLDRHLYLEFPFKT